MPNNSLNPKKNHKWPLIIGGLIILIILIPMVMLGADYMALNADNEAELVRIKVHGIGLFVGASLAKHLTMK